MCDRFAHMEAAIRLIKCLLQTIDYKVQHGQDGTLTACSDASFACCKPGKSRTGPLLAFAKNSDNSR